MSEENNLHSPYEAEVQTIVPSQMVKFFRVFWPWQLFRFAIINLKMIRMISKSHPHKLKTKHQ